MHLRLLGLLAAAAAALGASAPGAFAAAPQVSETWVSAVAATSAEVRGTVNPGALPTTARTEYIAASAYDANLAAGKDGFAGALKMPAGGPAAIGSGATDQPYLQRIAGLKPATAYRYRIVLVNSAATTLGPARSLVSEESAPVFSLPDNRGWELVSPPEKDGGQVDEPETVFGGGAFQAAAQGGAITYTSSSSFSEPQGSSGASQYLARRGASGWSTENLSVPQLSGGFDSGPGAGSPYRLFAADLTNALLTNGRRCRGEGSDCPVANPPLPGSGALAGYRNYYLRESAGGTFKALLGASTLGSIALGPEEFEVAFLGATADLGQIVLSSCAALSAEASEVPGPGGECDPAAQNLYLAQAGGLRLINLLPGDSEGTPGASLPAPGGAISADGNRVYFDLGGNLYLREGDQSFAVDAGVGGEGAFQTASTDGALALFTKEGHLYRYSAITKSATDLTPGGDVQGVLGASAGATSVYYLTTAGLFLERNGSVSKIAAGADSSNYPPTTGTARVSADGTRLAFLSSAPLGDYDNNGAVEVYLYSLTGGLRCVSCNPSGERPQGPSSIPGAFANGATLRTYKPRVLSDDGTRLFFESRDSLVPQDSNSDRDVYQWEAQGSGSCVKAGGCVNLISSGRAEGGARFVDASADGADVFFTTAGSLVPGDPGANDLYDARIGGGFPLSPTPIACLGDACQPLPPEPEDPTPGTLLQSGDNPPIGFSREGKPAKKRKKGHRKHRAKGRKHRTNKHGGKKRRGKGKKHGGPRRGKRR